MTTTEARMSTFCGHPACESILRRLANVVRARLAYDEHPGYNDAMLCVREGLLDFDDGVTFASRCGISEGAFRTFVELDHGRDDLEGTKFVWKELRLLIFERDKGCVRCQDGYQQVHHIRPLSQGGELILPCNLEALCQDCHVAKHRRAQPRVFKPSPVRAEGWEGLGENVTLYRDKGVRLPAPLRHGQVPTRHVLFDRWSEIRWILANVLHDDATRCSGGDRWKRVEMVMSGLKLQATRGKCFASAQYLADKGSGNKKTWDRCLARLRSLFLVWTERLYRSNGSQSVNLTDFSMLWALILRLLNSRNIQFTQLSNGLWLKQGGVWLHLMDCLDAWFPVPGPPLEDPEPLT